MKSESLHRSSGRLTRKKGCLIALLLIVVCVAIAGYFALAPVREAKRGEQDLLDRYATVPEFVPAFDGAIAPDRLEIFITVRQTLLASTGQTQNTYGRINKTMNSEDISTSEGIDVLKDVMGAFPLMVEFYRVRNGELLNHGMGLGEYFYIYAVAYGDRLCPLPADESATHECEFVTSRTTRELTQILQNQLDNPETPASLTGPLKQEIGALKRGEIVLPWQEGLPVAIAASLAPFQQLLDPLFCLETRELEFGQKNKAPGGITE